MLRGSIRIYRWWVDYKKAYDSVPHAWILVCLELYKCSPTLVQFLRLSMKQWKTVMSVNGLTLGTVSIKRGIFQGDSLSPLLFVLSLFPLLVIFHQTDKGY